MKRPEKALGVKQETKIQIVISVPEQTSTEILSELLGVLAEFKKKLAVARNGGHMTVLVNSEGTRETVCPKRP